MESNSWIDLLQRRFEPVRAQLAKGDPPAALGAMSAAAKIIHKHASRPWQLAISEGSQAFRFNTAQNTLTLGDRSFNRLMSYLIESISNSNDWFVRGAVEEITRGQDIESAITDILLALFLSHEFFHIDQQLGSDQYRDSDSYLKVVSALDYQADLAAFWFLTERVAPLLPVVRRRYLGLLMAVHIQTIHAFSRISEKAVSQSTFQRLLLWYFQMGRVVRSEVEPDLTHPSIQTMPIISFPVLETNSSLDPSLTPAPQIAGEVRQDIVIAICDGYGLQRALRMTSTEPRRMEHLVESISEGNFAEARNQLEELYHVHSAALDFLPGNLMVQALSAACAMADRLALGSASRILSRSDIEVISFFEKAERLILHSNPPLAGEGLANYRDWWREGSEAALDQLLTQRVGKSWRQAGRAEAVSDVLKGEILRIGSRLGASLDILLEPRSKPAPAVR